MLNFELLHPTNYILKRKTEKLSKLVQQMLKFYWLMVAEASLKMAFTK
jgi:hypothetical protein